MKRKTGFTLIELLVVVSIIALLVAILMPALGKARKQARNTVCLNNMKQWSTMFAMYTNDHNDRYMPGWAQEWRGVWMYALEDYYGGVNSKNAASVQKPGGVDDIQHHGIISLDGIYMCHIRVAADIDRGIASIAEVPVPLADIALHGIGKVEELGYISGTGRRGHAEVSHGRLIDGDGIRNAR